MNPRNRNLIDEFEDHLSQFSLVPPSENYSGIVNELQQNTPRMNWVFKRWSVTAAAVCTVAFIALAFDMLNPPQMTSGDQLAEAPTTSNQPDVQSVITTTTATSEQDYVAGRDYTVLTNPVVTNGSSTEVVAFFWYPCWPCSEFEDYLTKWELGLGSNVTLTRIPAMWSASMRFHAQAYYTAQLLGVMDNAHPRFYTEFERDNPNIITEADLQRFFENLGISASDFLTAYHSDTMAELIQQAEALNRAYQLQSTPTVFVAGKYSISPANAGGYSEVLDVADYLISNP